MFSERIIGYEKGWDRPYMRRRKSPYRRMRIVALVQLILGCVLLLLGIVQISINELGRQLVLYGGTCALWCPLPVIATGIIGLFISRRRHFDLHCLSRSFMVMSLLSGIVFMMALVLSESLVQIRVLNESVTDIGTDEISLRAQAAYALTQPESTRTGGLAMACIIICVALAEIVFGTMVGTIMCCGYCGMREKILNDYDDRYRPYTVSRDRDRIGSDPGDYRRHYQDDIYERTYDGRRRMDYRDYDTKTRTIDQHGRYGDFGDKFYYGQDYARNPSRGFKSDLYLKY